MEFRDAGLGIALPVEEIPDCEAATIQG